MSSTYRRILAMLAIACLPFGVAACGGDDDGDKSSSDSPPAAAGKVIQSDPANASKGTITVGSKNFEEQYTLG